MKKSTKNIIAAAGTGIGAAAAAVAATYIASNRLIDMALNRFDGEEIRRGPEKKISGVGLDAKAMEIRNAASKKLENSRLEQVEMTATDGTRLIGHWHKAEKPKRTIIAMHGWRSSWAKDFAMLYDFCHRDNCNVLYVEQRGQNGSDGKYMGFGMLERYDCIDWIKWVEKNKPAPLPIYLWGISMGATTVMMASELEVPENVHGIIADCGYTSPYAIWKHVAENNMKLHYGGIIAKITDDICKKRIQVGSRDVSATEALKKCRVPVLFIHGSDDHFVPVEMTYENYKACASPKKILIVPGAEHGMSYPVDKDSYEKTVLDFWEEWDKKTDFRR